MKTTKNAVNKALTPEEKAILGNIRSLLEQLDSADMADDMNEPAIAEEETIVENASEEEEFPEDDMIEEEEIVEKSSTPDEVANNGAEQRLNAEDVDVENALAVIKSYLTKSANKKTAIRKSADLVRLEKKVDNLADAVGGILEGMGVVDSAKTRVPIQKSARDVLSRLENLVNKSASRDQTDGSLQDVLTSLFQ